MANRQTLNVSLPPAQEHFVRDQVAVGRYRTASEVVRHGLRLLEETEHRRLMEKWLYKDLSSDELALLPDEHRERVQAHFRSLVEDAVLDIKGGHVADGPSAVKRLRQGIEARQK